MKVPPNESHEGPLQEECDHAYDEPVYTGTGGPKSVKIRTCKKCGYRDEVEVQTPYWLLGGRK